MGKESLNPGKWLNLLVSEPYYLFHFLTFFSYFVIRSSATNALAPHIAHHLLRREMQTLIVFSLLAFIKGVKEETWEAFIPDAIFLAKICLFALAYTMDRCLAIWYILVFLVLHMLTQQPPFEESGTSNKLTPLQLESLLTEGKTSRFWLVEFRASYSSACIRSSRCFSDLAITYSNKNLSFGIVDLGLFPNAAENFGISLSGSMSQLPTFILFDNATEVTRYPELDFEGKYFQPTITKSIIEHIVGKNEGNKGLLARHFELDRHLLDYVNGK